MYVVDGGWSEWRLGPCSKTCGGGIQNYTRVCDNPKPSNGGKQCKGPSFYTRKQICNSECCPGQMKCILLPLCIAPNILVHYNMIIIIIIIIY